MGLGGCGIVFEYEEGIYYDMFFEDFVWSIVILVYQVEGVWDEDGEVI